MRTEHAAQAGREDTHLFGRERGAGLVLEGLVLIDAGVVRQIHASLVSTSRRTSLWSRHFRSRNDDIFAVHGAIADAVAESLGLRFVPGHRQYSINPSLQTTFLRARALQADGGTVARPEAIDLFEQITKQAATFAPALAALATTLGGHLSIAGPPPPDRRLADAARTAYEVDASPLASTTKTAKNAKGTKDRHPRALCSFRSGHTACELHVRLWLDVMVERMILDRIAGKCLRGADRRHNAPMVRSPPT
jgi:hypothetical protein